MAHPYFEDEGVLKKKIGAQTDIAQKGIQQETELEKARIETTGRVEQQEAANKGVLKLEQAQQGLKVTQARETRLGGPGGYEAGQLDPAKIKEARGKMEAAGVSPENIPFEQPIHVIRRMESTFAAGPGGKGDEYSDLHLARQAINRGLGVGQFETPETTAAKADPLKRFQATAGEMAVAQKDFVQRLSKYGKRGEDGGLTFSPVVQQILDENAPRTLKDIDTAISKVQPLLEKASHIEKLDDVKASRTLRVQMIENYKKLPPDQKPMSDEDAEKYLGTFKPTMQNIDWAMKYGGLGGNLKPTASGAAPAAPTNQAGTQMTITKGGPGFVPMPPGYAPGAAAAATPAAAAPTTVASLRPGAKTPADEAAAYRQDYETKERLAEVMGKPIHERTPEDMAFLQGLPPDSNIQAQVGLHSFRKFFSATPDEYERRLGLSASGQDQLAQDNYRKNVQKLLGESYGDTW